MASLPAWRICGDMMSTADLPFFVDFYCGFIFFLQHWAAVVLGW